MTMRYPLTAGTGLQDTHMLEWSERTTLTLLTRRLADVQRDKQKPCPKALAQSPVQFMSVEWTISGKRELKQVKEIGK